MKEKWFKGLSVLYHSAIKITGEQVVYLDPYALQEEPRDGDVIFITHGHYDHFSKEDLEKVRKADSWIVVPEDLKKEALSMGFSQERVIGVRPGEKGRAAGVAFEAVWAYNKEKPFHPKENQWVGYVVTLNGIRYYIAGDTDMTEENRNISCDVALVPVGGTYTMDSSEAAALVNELKPTGAVPTHYGCIVGNKEDGEAFKKRLSGEIDCRLLLSF